MNAHPFVLHLQANGCIDGDDSRCIVVLSQLYCGLKLRSDSNKYDTGSVSILKVLLYSDSADELCLHPRMMKMMMMMMMSMM